MVTGLRLLAPTVSPLGGLTLLGTCKLFNFDNLPHTNILYLLKCFRSVVNLLVLGYPSVPCIAFHYSKIIPKNFKWQYVLYLLASLAILSVEGWGGIGSESVLCCCPCSLLSIHDKVKTWSKLWDGQPSFTRSNPTIWTLSIHTP